jgi:hypothetical protein
MNIQQTIFEGKGLPVFTESIIQQQQNIMVSKESSKKINKKISNNNITNLTINNSSTSLMSNMNFKKEQSFYSENSENAKKQTKPRKKRINNLDDTLRFEGRSERRELLAFDNMDIHYKKRKIKVDPDHNIDMEEYYDRIENKINFEEIDYERGDMKKMWSCTENLLSDFEIEQYLRNARMFWRYSNLHVDHELCDDFFDDLNTFLKNNKVCAYNKKTQIEHNLIFLKKFMLRSSNLNGQFDEMALKILHICRYNIKIALLFLFKGMNPFVEGNFIKLKFRR